MDGDNIDDEDCDILQYCTQNSCFDPPLFYVLHSTTADVVRHTTLTTTGAVGWSKTNVDSLDQQVSF